MRWVERLSSAITATRIRLAVATALALAATSFFYLGVTSTRTAQVSESVNSTDSTDSTIVDEIDVRSSASWHCAGVPIAVRCPPSVLASPEALEQSQVVRSDIDWDRAALTNPRQLMRSAVSDMKAMGPPGDVRGLQFDIACVGSETANIEGLPADVRLADYPASANQILCLKRAAPKLDRQVVVAQASNDAELSAALL